MHIRVINKHYDSTPGEYIGRPSVLGNPFVIGQDGDRVQVVNKYRRWLWQGINQGDSILKELHRLREQAYRHELVLVCWCKRPRKDVACHGDVIKQAIEWLDYKERGEPELVSMTPEAFLVETIPETVVETSQLSIFNLPLPTQQAVPVTEMQAIGGAEVPELFPEIPKPVLESAAIELLPSNLVHEENGKTEKAEQLSLPGIK